MKVRLKRMEVSEEIAATGFQFHEGPIKTRQWTRYLHQVRVSIP